MSQLTFPNVLDNELFAEYRKLPNQSIKLPLLGKLLKCDTISKLGNSEFGKQFGIHRAEYAYRSLLYFHRKGLNNCPPIEFTLQNGQIVEIDGLKRWAYAELFEVAHPAVEVQGIIDTWIVPDRKPVLDVCRYLGSATDQTFEADRIRCTQPIHTVFQCSIFGTCVPFSSKKVAHSHQGLQNFCNSCEKYSRR